MSSVHLDQEEYILYVSPNTSNEARWKAFSVCLGLTAFLSRWAYASPGGIYLCGREQVKYV